MEEARVLLAVINAAKANPEITWEEVMAMEGAEKVPLFHLRYAYTTGLRQTLEE